MPTATCCLLVETCSCWHCLQYTLCCRLTCWIYVCSNNKRKLWSTKKLTRCQTRSQYEPRVVCRIACNGGSRLSSRVVSTQCTTTGRVSRNDFIKTDDHETSKSRILRFTNFETSLYSRTVMFINS